MQHMYADLDNYAGNSETCGGTVFGVRCEASFMSVYKNFVRNLFHSDKHSTSCAGNARAETHLGFHVKCPALLSDFNKHSTVLSHEDRKTK
jgi:hypothetical protein